MARSLARHDWDNLRNDLNHLPISGIDGDADEADIACLPMENRNAEIVGALFLVFRKDTAAGADGGLRGELRLDEPLSGHTSWRVGGPARQLYRPADKADLLSASISTAMNTTAFGLMVAIPLLLLHALLQTKTTELVDSLEMASVKFLNTLTEGNSQEAA